MVLLLGDLNKQIGSDKWGVKGNNDKVTYGGQLIRDFLASKEFVLINNMDVAQGGPFTWQDPADPDRKSCLDLFICSVDLQPYVKSLVIDSKREFSIKRALFSQGKFRTIFPDHYPAILTLHKLQGVSKEKEKATKWNLNKPGGWELYHKISDQASDKIDKIVEDKSKNIDEVMNEFEKIHDKVKFKTFGKTTIGKINKEDKKKIFKSSEEEAEDLVRERAKKIESEVNEMKESNKGRVGNIIQLSKSINGNKKGGMEAQAVKHPESGKLLGTPEEIKSAVLLHCTKVLENNKPEEGFEKEIKLKDSLHDIRMSDYDNETSDFKVDIELFNNVIKKV